jgi:alkylation response protein AidB-like acyl-CoA dehydrogenase
VGSIEVDGNEVDGIEPDGIEVDRDAELLEFRSTVRRVLDRHTVAAGVADSPQTPAGGYDPQLWKLLTHQVGVAGLAVPERFGGSGFGYRECHLVLEELGRVVVASPFLASAVLATQALLLAGDNAAAELLPDLAAGTRTAALVWGTGDPLTATRTEAGWLINGRMRHVLDGARADLLLAFAEPQPELELQLPTVPGTEQPPADPEPALFLLDITHPGLQRDLLPTMDQSLHLAEVRCRAVPARRLSGADPTGLHPHHERPGRPVLSRLADLAATAVTADQAGGARRCLELTVEYTKTRVQFGRQIGSFQAIKHRLADLLVLVESAQSASQAAAEAWANDAEDAPVLASLAKSYCSEAYRAVAAESIQLHGGIGFTWEHQAHRYFKRAHATSALFGTPAQHRRLLATHLGLPSPSPR